MPKYRAKCDSYGFNGRYWDKDDIGEFTATEVKQIPKAYFSQLFESIEPEQEEQGTAAGE